jgi:hypothetical protein
MAGFSKEERGYMKSYAHQGEDTFYARTYADYKAALAQARASDTLADPKGEDTRAFDAKMARIDQKTGMSTLKKLLESQDYSSGYDPCDYWTGGDY